MSPPATWTPPPPPTSWTCWTSCTTPAAPSCSSPMSTTSPPARGASCGYVTVWSPKTRPLMRWPLRECGHDLVRHTPDRPGSDAYPPDALGADGPGDPHRYRGRDLDRRPGHWRP